MAIWCSFVSAMATLFSAMSSGTVALCFFRFCVGAGIQGHTVATSTLVCEAICTPFTFFVQLRIHLFDALVRSHSLPSMCEHACILRKLTGERIGANLLLIRFFLNYNGDSGCRCFAYPGKACLPILEKLRQTQTPSTLTP